MTYRFALLGALHLSGVLLLIAASPDRGTGQAPKPSGVYNAPGPAVALYGAGVSGAGITADDWREGMEEWRGMREELKGMRAELASLKSAVTGGAKLSPPAPKVLVPAEVAAARCARCHTPGKADVAGGGYVMFADDLGKALKPVSAKQRAAESELVRNQVESGAMPKGGAKLPADEQKVLSKLWK